MKYINKKNYFRASSSILASLCFGVFVTTTLVHAQDVTFEAEVSATTVTLGTYVRLTLTAAGAQQLDPIDLPEIEGFDVEFIGPSSRVSIVNGVQSSSYAFLYNLYPHKIGNFGIPVIKTIINGKEYVTKPININVVDSDSASTVKELDESAEPSLQERLFVTLKIEEQQAYLKSEVPVLLRLFISGISVKDVEMPSLEHDGFLISEYDKPVQYEKIINGTRYSIVEFQTSVFPLKTGELTLGPAKIRCNVVFQDAAKAGRPRRLFDDDFFDGFFSTYTIRPITIDSNSALLNIQPLPEEKKPNNFSGAVGKFSFNFDVSPTKVKVGDPITVRMFVKGEGSLDTFDLEGFSSNENFKAYDPEVRKEDNTKILEQVLIPQHENATEIPAVDFSFFDTEQQDYRTISWGPVKIEVDPVEKGQEFSVVGNQTRAENMFVRQDKLGKGINFIHSRMGRIVRTDQGAYRSPLFVILVIVIIILWMAGIVYYQFLAKLKTDTRFAKRLKAPQYANQGLKTAKSLLAKHDTQGFYNELFMTIQKYFEHKCHLSPGTVSSSAIKGELLKRGKDVSIMSKVEQVFDECEAVRYASVSYGYEEMNSSYQAVREVIDWFERKF